MDIRLPRKIKIPVCLKRQSIKKTKDIIIVLDIFTEGLWNNR
jgi:hypothetical protein